MFNYVIHVRILNESTISLVTFPYIILTSFRRIRRCTCGVSKAVIAAAATKGGRPEQLEKRVYLPLGSLKFAMEK